MNRISIVVSHFDRADRESGSYQTTDFSTSYQTTDGAPGLYQTTDALRPELEPYPGSPDIAPLAG